VFAASLLSAATLECSFGAIPHDTFTRSNDPQPPSHDCQEERLSSTVHNSLRIHQSIQSWAKKQPQNKDSELANFSGAHFGA